MDLVSAEGAILSICSKLGSNAGDLADGVDKDTDGAEATNWHASDERVERKAARRGELRTVTGNSSSILEKVSLLSIKLGFVS